MDPFQIERLDKIIALLERIAKQTEPRPEARGEVEGVDVRSIVSAPEPEWGASPLQEAFRRAADREAYRVFQPYAVQHSPQCQLIRAQGLVSVTAVPVCDCGALVQRQRMTLDGETIVEWQPYQGFRPHAGVTEGAEPRVMGSRPRFTWGPEGGTGP